MDYPREYGLSIKVQKYTNLTTGLTRIQLDNPGESQMSKKHMISNCMENRLRAKTVIQ